MTDEWQPIETAPRDTWVLLWWTPVDDNEWAETAIIGQVSAYHEGKMWYGEIGEPPDYKERYGELERCTHWMPKPPPPADRAKNWRQRKPSN